MRSVVGSRLGPLSKTCRRLIQRQAETLTQQLCPTHTRLDCNQKARQELGSHLAEYTVSCQADKAGCRPGAWCWRMGEESHEEEWERLQRSLTVALSEGLSSFLVFSSVSSARIEELQSSLPEATTTCCLTPQWCLLSTPDYGESGGIWT